MDRTNLADRIRIESQILSLVREALVVAVDAPFDSSTAEQWCERCRFLTDSFRRHVERMFLIKWEIDDRPLALESERPGLMDELAEIEAQQRRFLAELNLLSREAYELAPDNLANLYAFRQRVLGFVERFDELRLLEAKVWMDGFQVDIGGEG
jgi:hypothetical protein